MDKDLKNNTIEELEQIVDSFGGKKYLAKYIFSFIHAQDIVEIDGLTTLKKELRQKLADEGYFISKLDLVEKFVDPDGTVKYLFEMADGVRVESVLMTSKDRKTVCISCQAGCRMGCDFCATAKLRFRRNLTAAEIVDQVNMIAKDAGTVNNVVYMGMGEPLDNYDETMRSLRIINHHAGKNIGQRHLTISTCGIPEAIDRFADEKLQVHLSISLHSADQNKREKLMSVANRHGLDEIKAAVKRYQQRTNRRVMFACCMIAGFNDSDHDARGIIKLLTGINANVNLIEFNEHPGCELAASSNDRVARFMDLLMQAGIETTVRYKKGSKIKGACGQLGAAWLEKEIGK
ncbi:MAG: 23S rRNA (adenine(2503)-C(2))-methyltransferase RlmN [Anaerohalosphaera sp.]|nr:23S rRNA (adenine(2503)-C(2))-methyltransferase RlmN [Anaerohalosphaera sp.]